MMVTQTEVKILNTGKATDNGHMTQEKATDYRNAKQKMQQITDMYYTDERE